MRRMVWIKTTRIEAWTCSECAWTFNPSGPPRGDSLEEMKRNYERQRDNEYASHVCAEHPRGKSATDDSRMSR
jgi:rubredoxin